MASRLSRWSLVTLGGSALIAAMLISSSGAPIGMVLRSFWLGQDDDPFAARREAVQYAINGTLSGLRSAREEERLRPIRAAAADPSVYRKAGPSYEADPEEASTVDSLWRTIPVRNSGVRTIVLLNRDDLVERFAGTARLREAGICLTTVPWYRRSESIMTAVARDAGECAYTEWFGWPGAGVRSWIDTLPYPTHLRWTALQRQTRWIGRGEAGEEGTAPWFSFGDWTDYYRSGNWYWSPRARVWVACAYGRQDQCVKAYGVAGTRPAYGPRGYYGYFGGDPTPNDGLLYALHQELGAERFQQVWSSNDPIATSYQRVTGKPIDEWLVRWTQASSALRQRDNGLSAWAWVGAFAWLFLLGAWCSVRYRGRVVT